METNSRISSFRLSRTKTEYIEYKFNKHGIRDYSIVTLDGQEIPMSSHFKYLGSDPKGCEDQ